MLVKRFVLENVRSFLDRTELFLDGNISIIIGPNGGGKTNLLDAVVVFLRRYLFASMYVVHAPTPEQQDRYEFRFNDVLNHMILERHSQGSKKDQLLEVELIATDLDIKNLHRMFNDNGRLLAAAEERYFFNSSLSKIQEWDLSAISAGQTFTYRLVNGSLTHDETRASSIFLEYLQLFEIDGSLREELGEAPLSIPLVYLPINRTSNGLPSAVELGGYNYRELKRQNDATYSRNGNQIASLAVGQLATKFRLLLEKNDGQAEIELEKDENLGQLTKLLADLGYGWALNSVNPLRNQYDFLLKKNGIYFSASAGSSGERELLTYLLAIFCLNIRNALIIVDEPELHLHPRWQKALLKLFATLSKNTGNQFLLATHAPTFVSPESIQFVSRVTKKNEKSHITRIKSHELPEAKHLFNIVNSQNNERIFFADHVVLVEGLSDRLFFEAILDKNGRTDSSKIIEVVSAGGKNFFEAYKKILESCEIDYSIVADLDYVEEIAPAEFHDLFVADAVSIKRDVIDNTKSRDATALCLAIDSAMLSQDWGEAISVWNYIKSRQRALVADLTMEKRKLLDSFIIKKREQGVFILKRGALEDYLPEGHRKKDLDKLIRLLCFPDYWDKLQPDGRSELKIISECIISRSS